MMDTDDHNEEKENQPNSRIKPARVTKDQYKKIDKFHQGIKFVLVIDFVAWNILKKIIEHDETLIEKKVFGELWDDLAAKLNDIGPPAFSVAEWKKKWSFRKYNQKKQQAKRLAEISPDQSLVEIVDFEQSVLEKFDQMLTNQEVVIQNQNVIIKSLESLLAKTT